MVADRRRLAAYHDKHCWRAFTGYQHQWPWTIKIEKWRDFVNLPPTSERLLPHMMRVWFCMYIILDYAPLPLRHHLLQFGYHLQNVCLIPLTDFVWKSRGQWQVSVASVYAAWRRFAASAWSCSMMPASIHSIRTCYLYDILCALNIKLVNSVDQICISFLAETYHQKYQFRTRFSFARKGLRGAIV